MSTKAECEDCSTALTRVYTCPHCIESDQAIVRCKACHAKHVQEALDDLAAWTEEHPDLLQDTRIDEAVAQLERSLKKSSEKA
jgi:hypothetical protein